MFNPTYIAREVQNDPKQIIVTADGFLGKSEMTLPITLGTFAEGMEKRHRGALVQDAFPMLNKTQREFLISGMNMEDQADVFGEEVEA